MFVSFGSAVRALFRRFSIAELNNHGSLFCDEAPSSNDYCPASARELDRGVPTTLFARGHQWQALHVPDQSRLTR